MKERLDDSQESEEKKTIQCFKQTWKTIKPGPWNHEKAFHQPHPKQTSLCDLDEETVSVACQIHAQECQQQYGHQLGECADPHEHWSHQHKHEPWHQGNHLELA